jgi:hypothetical protein
MNSTKYYSKPEHVLFFDPITRLLAKLFGASAFVIKCKDCKRIPTEFTSEGKCLSCDQK